MRRNRWLGPGAGAFALLASTVATAEEFGGLPVGPGKEEVFYACNACHSLELVTQQRLSWATWDKLLASMVEEHGMAPFEPTERERVLAYLDQHFGPDIAR